MARLIFAMPDPNARRRVGPTEMEWSMADRPISGWVSPATENEWTYFWLDGSNGDAFYRCYRADTDATPWQPVASHSAVFALTGEEQDDEERDEPGAGRGAAEKLPAGIYKLDFKCCFEQQDFLFDGIQFEILTAADQQRVLDSVKISEIEI